MLHQFKALADGVWLDSEPITILGMPLASNMTVVRLRDGALLVHSPVAMSPARRASVDALGPVAHLYAPNTFHHLALGDWAAAYSSARIHAPAGLVKKRRDLRIDRLLALPFERLVVGHGLPVVERAREALGQAYAWLPAAQEAAT